MKTSALHTLVLLGAAVACSPADPPTRPSWDQDVLPILQGSCNHCHGASKSLDPVTGMAAPPGPVFRLDVCNAQAPLIMQSGVQILGVGALSLNTSTITTFLQPVRPNPRASMPPPPASPLSDYDLQVLKRWARIAMGPNGAEAACEKAVPNRRPVVNVIEEPIQDGNDAVAVVDISDADHDQVLGKFGLGNVTVTVPGSGRRRLVFEGGSAGQVLTWDLTDGYDRVTQ